MALRHGFVQLWLRDELLLDDHAAWTLTVRLTLSILVRDFHLAKEADDAITIVALLWLHSNLTANHAGGLGDKLLLEFVLRIVIVAGEESLQLHRRKTALAENVAHLVVGQDETVAVPV